MGLTINDSGYWIYVESEEKPSYVITGKYLFFSENQDRLIAIAKNEILNNGFHVAKVNSRLLGSNTEYVLCLYYQDDSRKYELAERHGEQYSDTKYRYWKSDEDTLKGKYSEEFLSKLDGADKQHFTTDKTKRASLIRARRRDYPARVKRQNKTKLVCKILLNENNI